MNHLVVVIEGDEAFNPKNPGHLSAVVRALQRYPTVDGVVAGGLEETLITGKPLEVLKGLSETRRKLERFSRTLTPTAGKDGKTSRKCNGCPSSPSEVMRRELERFDRDPLEWTPDAGRSEGRGLPHCGDCIKRTQRLLAELSEEAGEVFRRIELLG